MLTYADMGTHRTAQLPTATRVAIKRELDIIYEGPGGQRDQGVADLLGVSQGAVNRARNDLVAGPKILRCLLQYLARHGEALDEDGLVSKHGTQQLTEAEAIYADVRSPNLRALLVRMHGVADFSDETISYMRGLGERGDNGRSMLDWTRLMLSIEESVRAGAVLPDAPPKR
jgi:hypothetical protein